MFVAECRRLRPLTVSQHQQKGKIMGKGNNSQKNDKKNKKPKKDNKTAAKK